MSEKEKKEPKRTRTAITYDKDYHPKWAKKYVLSGFSYKEICEAFRINKQLLESWARKHDEFLEALRSSKHEFDAEMIGLLGLLARGYEYSETNCHYEVRGRNEKLINKNVTTKYVQPNFNAIKYLLAKSNLKRFRETDEEKKDRPTNVNIKVVNGRKKSE